MIATKYIVIGTVIVTSLLGLAYYKYQYENKLIELAEVEIARDAAIAQLDILAKNYADQVQKTNDYQSRIAVITKANQKISSELDSYRTRISILPLPDAELEANKKTDSILQELRK